MGGWRLGRIGGIEIRMDPSLLFIAGLLTFEFWAEVSDRARYFGTSRAAAIGAAVIGAILFFASILCHELAHAGMCRVRGIPVSGITLWMLGGATHARIESRGPLDEFLVTVVGPGTSLALGGLFLGAWSVDGGATGDSFAYMLGRLGGANVILGLFNLLPGFPLDGGRLLRSVLWRVTGSISRATRLAARAGQGTASVLIAFGILVFLRTERLDALWLALIGSFLFRAAAAAAAEGERHRRLESATARAVMSPPPPTVPAGLSVEEALHRYLVGHEGEAFPVVEGDRVVGFVSLGTIHGADLDRPVREAMTGTGGTVQARPNELLSEVTKRLGDAPGRTVLVMENGSLVGVIEPEDMARFLRGPTRPTRPRGQVRPRSAGPPPRPEA